MTCPQAQRVPTLTTQGALASRGAGAALALLWVLLQNTQAMAAQPEAGGDDTRLGLQLLALALLVVAIVGVVTLTLALRRRQSHAEAPQPDAGRRFTATPEALFTESISGGVAVPSTTSDTWAMGGVTTATASSLTTSPTMLEPDVHVEDDTLDSPTPSDYLDTGLSVRVCPSCDRVYDVSAEYCPHDGQRLQHVEGWTALEPQDDVPMVCPTCGTRHDPGVAWCAHDGARLTPEDPQSLAFVTVGVLFCPACHSEFLPGRATCPYDQTTLLPMMGRHTCGLPARGHAPHTRVCSECGTAYAQDLAFCAIDGADLTNVN